MVWYFKSSSFSFLEINVSTYDNLRWLISIYVFPSKCRCIYIQITNFMKISLTACKVFSGDISKDRNKTKSCYINRVDIPTLRWLNTVRRGFFKMHISTYIHLHIAIFELFKSILIFLRCVVSIQLDLLSRG